MLKLEHINKTYKVDESLQVNALKDINLEFDNTGFVCILGQSGCGKTTLLNILGGLDKYTSGDLIINNQSTKEYKDSDWDNYRNKEIGIVFQAYNLIPHLSVLENVSLAMTLSGVSKKEREERAKDALISVGLEKELKKKPNQMSGGQMQRVALARALVNRPNIILADEPTGALDSNTSVQVMDILKEISKTKLVITVTHNEELANTYASRIIRLKDGDVISDEQLDNNDIIDNETNEEDTKEEKQAIEIKEDISPNKKKKHTSMSFKTALGISGRNLLTKKGKTIITSIAASFGIIGVGLVLALSNGFTNYVTRMEAETLNKFPLSIEKYSLEDAETKTEKLPEYPSDNTLHIVEPSSSNYHLNSITTDYVNYLEKIDKEKAKVRYNYSVGMNVISSYKNRNDDEMVYKHLTTSQTSFVESMTSSMTGGSTGWNELTADKKTILDTYDVIYQAENTTYPDEDKATSNNNKIDQKEFGLVLVVGRRNSLTTTLMTQMGLDPTSGVSYSFEELAKNIEYKYIMPDDFYQEEKIIERKTALFFKDGITYQDLSSALKSLATDSSKTLNLSDCFDLPNQEVLMQVLLNQVGTESFNKLSNYIKVGDLINDIVTNKVNLNNITNKAIKKYLNDNLLSTSSNYQTERENCAIALYDFIDQFFSDELMKDYTQKDIKTYLEPKTNEQYEALYNNSNNRTLKITTILRPKETTDLPILSSGIYYPKSLTYQSLTDFGDSKIGKEFKNHIMVEKNENLKTTFTTVLSRIIDEEEEKKISEMNLLSGISNAKLGILLNSYKVTRVNNETSSLKLEKYDSVDKYLTNRLYLGSDVNNSKIKFEGTIDPSMYAQFVSTITIYATDYSSKGYIIDYLGKYNEDKVEKDKIYYMDVGGLATDTVGQIVSVISAVLISFASISLVVSSIMIAILIYTSVIERTKEIGVLRSIGARKKDVGRLFKAEAMIIGFLSGSIGVIFTYLISLPISLILNLNFKDVHLGQIAFLNPLHAVLLIVLSTGLTYLASLIPSRIASKKDPVTCLRSE